MRGSIADKNYDKRENKEKRFFRLVTIVGQRKKESPRGIEPQTFGFRSPMLYCIIRNVRL